jgi:hypothetical protein
VTKYLFSYLFTQFRLMVHPGRREEEG